ncbi:MAG: hypothetical protein NVSMB29_13250 [Candidatus Dormibacteria bacterium]
MAYLRLNNGNDVSVQGSVAEVIEKLAGGDDGDFVVLEGEDGRVHVRAAAVLAILDGPDRRTSGFRMPSER